MQLPGQLAGEAVAQAFLPAVSPTFQSADYRQLQSSAGL
jgi:hypothetical protein